MTGYFVGAAFFLVGAPVLHFGVRAAASVEATRAQYRLFRRLMGPTTEERYVRRATTVFTAAAVVFAIVGLACLAAGLATL
jgi:hypothetical protein